MEYVFFVFSDEIFIRRISCILQQLGRYTNLQMKLRKISIDSGEYFYSIRISRGGLSESLDIGEPDVFLLARNATPQLFNFVKDKLKKTTLLISRFNDDYEASLYDSMKNEIPSKNDEQLVSEFLWVLSQLLSIKSSTIIKILKSLKEGDTNSLIETFKLVAKNERIKRP